MGGHFKKVVTFGTKRFIRYSMHVRYWEVSLYVTSPLFITYENMQTLYIAIENVS